MCVCVLGGCESIGRDGKEKERRRTRKNLSSEHSDFWKLEIRSIAQSQGTFTMDPPRRSCRTHKGGRRQRAFQSSRAGEAIADAAEARHRSHRTATRAARVATRATLLDTRYFGRVRAVAA